MAERFLRAVPLSLRQSMGFVARRMALLLQLHRRRDFVLPVRLLPLADQDRGLGGAPGPMVGRARLAVRLWRRASTGFVARRMALLLLLRRRPIFAPLVQPRQSVGQGRGPGPVMGRTVARMDLAVRRFHLPAIRSQPIGLRPGTRA
jgi:hypothetical protein